MIVINFSKSSFLYSQIRHMHDWNYIQNRVKYMYNEAVWLLLKESTARLPDSLINEYLLWENRANECDSGIWAAHWLADIVYKDVVRYPDVSWMELSLEYWKIQHSWKFLSFPKLVNKVQNT